ncbi:heavy metal translocating P-type ATPase [Cardiobacteriaceae bacterium TAE3-ERU3]|nr:heavy metal translocating P-type ATPase [Cardiobacteriaceae bacterium TAE3-ERU3]
MSDATTCYHCRLPIPTGIDVHADLNGAERHFCCHACLGVASLIHQQDLGAYYQARDNAAPRPDNITDEQHWRAYGLPAVAEQYVYTDESGSHELHLYIDGIHCAACSWLIRSALERAELVDDVRVNTTNGRAEIRWHDSQLSDILITIARLGYTPNLFTPSQDESHQHRIRNQSLLRLIVAGLGMMQVMMFATGLYSGDFLGIEREYSELLRWVSMALTTPVMFYSGWPFLAGAWQGLRVRRINMDLPIAIATLGAYLASVYHTLIGSGEVYFDSVTMFIFFLSISRFLEFLARRRARLNDIRFAKLLPDAVSRREADGSHTLIPLTTVQHGDTITVHAGHTIPVDGTIASGSTRIDEAMLSGESTPLTRSIGDPVLAGSTNLQSPIDIHVEQTGQQTTLAAIRRLIDRAAQHRSPIIDRNERIARHTIALVLVLAAAGYLVWQFIAPERAFDIALAVLVATCPCALSLATPTALTSALNHANRLGILIKDSNTIDRLGDINNILFDKTGTLTGGQLTLTHEHISHPNPARIWQIAKALEQNSSHPIAWYFIRQPIEAANATNIEQHESMGISGNIDGETWYIGSATLMQQHGHQPLSDPTHDQPCIDVYLANADGIQAHFTFADPLRPDLARTLAQLRRYQLHIASGDRSDNVRSIANALHINDAHGDLTPAAKLDYLNSLQGSTLMIGDGINDAPVLAAADVSVAVGKANPLSQTHADIVFLHHGPEALPFLFDLAANSKRLIKQNLVWSAVYNLTVLPLAIFGLLTPWIAALGMSASSLLVVLNALRVHRTPPPPTAHNPTDS